MPTAEQESPLDDLSNHQEYRVLLVSGNAMLKLTLPNFFEQSPISVTLAEERQEGLSLLREKTFDAIITDTGADGGEGLRFRQEVRLRDAGIPILFMTPAVYWSDMKLLDRIAEDPHSYYIPENADRKFMTAKLHQVIRSCQAESSRNQLRQTINRNWLLAGLLQQAMLPPWVYFGKNYEFSCFYRPFTRVSGDLFEWIPLDEERALFIFGDISGHGTHSALAMTAVQAFLKQIVRQKEERARCPHLIAAEINDFFCNQLHSIVHMSTLIAYFDFRENYLCFQNAGYLGMMCVDAETGEYVDINPEKKGSLPPGMVKDAVYSEADNVEFRFSDSSVFLSASDGLIDLAKDREGNNYLDVAMCKKLSSMLVTEAQHEDKSITIPFRAYHTLEQFGYLFPQDDLTMALIRKPLNLEKEYVFSCRVPADKKTVDEICEKASGFVTRCYHNETLSVNTELLLEEYLVNVIMHGLDEYEKLNEYIAVKLCAYPTELKLMIWDHGKEWNGLAMQQEDAERKLDELNETFSDSGRGLPIISMIASRIGRQRYAGLNESVFILPLPADNPASAPDETEKA